MARVSESTQSYIAIAKAAALNSTYRFRLGAVVVGGGRIRGVGWTKHRNIPRNLRTDHLKSATVHAEAAALRGLQLRRGTAYVCRLNARGEFTMAKPCNDCMLALLNGGVTKVYWTIDPHHVGVSKVEIL